jgi:hypothetical protein
MVPRCLLGGVHCFKIRGSMQINRKNSSTRYGTLFAGTNSVGEAFLATRSRSEPRSEVRGSLAMTLAMAQEVNDTGVPMRLNKGGVDDIYSTQIVPLDSLENVFSLYNYLVA